MDFITKLPRTRSGHDATWVVVDRLTKSSHFLAICEDYSTEKLARSPVLWAEIGDGSLIGPELVQETTDKVVFIKEKLQAARDRQKSYTDSGRKMTKYEVGENVLLKVSPWKGVMRFGKKEIMDREVKSLKRSRIPLVKVRWNSKRGPEFTWEREDYMKFKDPQLFVDRAVEPTS
ncbi:hypothetical protein Tco_1009778 [Tanacetum coccineum]